MYVLTYIDLSRILVFSFRIDYYAFNKNVTMAAVSCLSGSCNVIICF